MEQSLSEVNPDLVTKIIEGKNKRLKELERHSLERVKDLDQRSAETNTVSSTHLENFKEKAANKLKIAQDESKKYFNSLSSSLIT
jgi:flagellar biosynthesis chaperone FliJ